MTGNKQIMAVSELGNEEINKELNKLLRQFEIDKRVVIYCNKLSKRFSDDLIANHINFISEDVGGNPLAPEMWRFSYSDEANQ